VFLSQGLIDLPYHLPIYQPKVFYSSIAKAINPQRGTTRFTSGQMLHPS
jgi:hypothetical protein